MKVVGKDVGGVGPEVGAVVFSGFGLGQLREVSLYLVLGGAPSVVAVGLGETDFG